MSHVTIWRFIDMPKSYVDREELLRPIASSNVYFVNDKAVPGGSRQVDQL